MNNISEILLNIIFRKYVSVSHDLKNNFFYRTPLVTASVHWTITMLNLNRALENSHAMNEFNFTKFLSDREMRDGMLLLLSQNCFKQLLSESLI